MSARKPIDTSKYDGDNLAHARRVLANPERHGAGMVEWARMVVERIEGSQILNRQGPVEGSNDQNA